MERVDLVLFIIDMRKKQTDSMVMDKSEFCNHEGQECGFANPDGACCNGLVHRGGGQEQILEIGMCSNAKMNDVFGTMTLDGFTPDERDPNGFGRIAMVESEKVSLVLQRVLKLLD